MHHQAEQRQPRLLRAVRPCPALVAAAGTPPTSGSTGGGEDYDPSLLADPHESDLLGALGEYARIVASAAELREPHRVARYLEALAGTYHRFYDACRVLPDG